MNKLVPAIMINNLKAASETFEQVMQNKINDAIESKKFELAQLVGEKKLDKVDHDELDGDHDDREDKDIDNDGDVDSSDEYLHNRRKNVKKAISKEGVETDIAREKESITRSNEKIKGLQDKEDRKKSIGDKK